MEDADTICAVSTPPGEGGIGIIRISGAQSHTIADEIFQSKKKDAHSGGRRLRLGYIFNPKDKAILDEVFCVLMKGSHTYTREDMTEIYSHGGYAAQKAILSLIISRGARLAEPGEFTKRAFLNGRIDLPQAEAVLDIIHSETDEELQYAVKYLQGKLSKKIDTFRDALKQALVHIEALIDFPEEDIDVTLEDAMPALKKTQKGIASLIESYYEGRGISKGFEVLIAGKTNVGKSSLLNTLLLKERAIVTPIPGTTRDLIEDTIYLKGIKVKIIDTAGIREPDNPVEEEGIKRVREKIAEADLILWLLDGSGPISKEDRDVLEAIGNKPYIAVVNKSDLPRVIDINEVRSKTADAVEVSALTEDGLDRLREHIHGKLMGGKKRHDSLIVTNTRHRDTLAKVRDNIERALTLKEKGEPIELMAFELNEALFHLGEITGETTGGEILDEIFHRFCIGK